MGNKCHFVNNFFASRTLNMSACLVGGCAGESIGARLVNSSEKFPTSSSSDMYGLKGAETLFASTSLQQIDWREGG